MSMGTGIEQVQERIIEMLQTDPAVQALVNAEWDARFPTGVATEMLDETIYMCQLLVWRRILGEIA